MAASEKEIGNQSLATSKKSWEDDHPTLPGTRYKIGLYGPQEVIKDQQDKEPWGLFLVARGAILGGLISAKPQILSKAAGVNSQIPCKLTQFTTKKHYDTQQGIMEPFG